MGSAATAYLHISGAVAVRNLNLARRLITSGTNEKYAKMGQRGSGRVT